MTLVGASSLQHFLKSLQAINMVVDLVVDSLILLMINPLEPLSFLYFLFISSARAFSFVLSSKYYSGFSPSIGKPMIYANKSTSIYIGLSIHRIPPCTKEKICFTGELHLFLS
jgi:hypothetical protein